MSPKISDKDPITLFTKSPVTTQLCLFPIGIPSFMGHTDSNLLTPGGVKFEGRCSLSMLSGQQRQQISGTEENT